MIKYQNNTISRLYGDNTPAYTLISGGTAIHGEYSNPTTSVTITYTPVEWVSNENLNSDCWIDLGYVWNNNSRAQFKGAYGTSNGNEWFGERITNWNSGGPADDNGDLRWMYNNSTRGMYWDVPSGKRVEKTSYTPSTPFELEIGNFYIKNLQTGSNLVTGSAYNVSRTNTVGLFSASGGSGVIDKIKFYYIKIYEGDSLVMDIIPVLDKDNIPCFFDKISQEFFYYKVNGEPSTGLTYGNVGEESGITINYNTDLTTLTYDTPSGIIDTKINLNASANTGVELIYSSDDTSIATVDASGVVAPKASGTTTITIIASGTTIGNTTYRGVQKRLQIECDAPSSYVEVIYRQDGDSLHFMDNRGSWAYGMFWVKFIGSGNFRITYAGHDGNLYFNGFMTEEFYQNNPQGNDESLNTYYTNHNNGTVDFEGLPYGIYYARWHVYVYKGIPYRNLSGYFTID